MGRAEYTEKEKEKIVFLSEALKTLQNMNGSKITQSQIASATGIPQGTISRYISGKMLPKDEYLQRLADFFQVDISYFKKETNDTSTIDVSDNVLTLDKELEPKHHQNWISYGNKLLDKQVKSKQSHTVINLSEAKQKMVDYDFYDSAVSAGTGQFLGDAEREIISLPIDLPADFVIPVYGDSMEPEYQHGDYVFVKLTVDISSGDIGIFELYGDSYIKKIIIDGNKGYLRSLNSKYSDIVVDAYSDFRIIGKVIGKYSESNN